ncbi:hypothetical protein LCGC14_2970330 [marine sediment metagenome]|uniref:Tyrosine specific protein phosphatases domain-containing protein n=1 Tax=marine sediment metagenome TaxID=412755 RepID=A0A0F9A0U1_9ZZZZ
MLKKPKTYKRACWPHPLLEIRPGLRLVAGSGCAHPIVDDYDVYIGFDAMTLTTRHLPWTPGVEIHYRIDDMQAPKNAKTYRKLVDWTLEQLVSGARVHAGCIGGHGRTGMFFTALVAAATGRKDAILYVREHYCKKACETSTQIDFLVKHYGVDPVTASKCGAVGVGGWDQGGDMLFDDSWMTNKAIVPLVSSTTIWGDLRWDDDGEESGV